MQFLKDKFAPLLYRHLAALLSIVVNTLLLWPFDPYLEVQLIALLYLLPVMISTVLWGFTPGVLASFFAFLSFNYFFIPPYHTLQVHKTQDLITLIIFLIVAVELSQLIGKAREAVRLAHLREWEATRMYELISMLAGLQDPPAVAAALASYTLNTFHFQRVSVSIFAWRDEPDLTVTEQAVPSQGDGAPSQSNGTSPADGALSTDQGKANAVGEGQPETTFPLRTARGPEGEIRIWLGRPELTAEEGRLLEAFTSQGALALERIRLSRGEHKARLLEESDRMKSSLLNSVSHELRTPLAAIKASVSSLRSRAVEWDTAARQELLVTIEEETDHLNQLVGNLLDMSRIESGALKPQRRWNAIGEIATGVVIKMRKQLDDHTIEMDFPERLPLVSTDYIMVGQVFTNLISNSVKYSPAGTRIALSARAEGDFLHVQVTNQGPPVPEADLARIFDKFHRVTEADRVTGTGLGLSICKGIVEAHGGKIWAENCRDCFSFHFLLPTTLDGALPETPKEAVDG